VQQAGDRLVFGATCFENERGDAQEVCGVRNLRALALLAVVRLQRVTNRLVEPLGQNPLSIHVTPRL
jgi:hypothetical protein